MPAQSEKDICANAISASLFLTSSTDGQDLAPVVILQNDGANIYQVLERNIRTEALHQPDRFWRAVRDVTGFQTWRPRVNGTQLKMLQNARLPETVEEWSLVQAAVLSISTASYLRPESNVVTMLNELQTFTANVQEWWANRKKGDNNMNGNGNLKRAGSALQPLAKRPSLLDLQAAAGMYVLPDPAALQGMHMIGAMQLPNVGDDYNAALQEQQPQQEAQENGNVAPHKITVTLNVGGQHFETTLGTLAAVEGSYLFKMAQRVATTNSGEREFFIDRNGTVFNYILDYLRSQRYGDGLCVLPSDVVSLKSLLAESKYYRLSNLEEEIHTAISNATAADDPKQITAIFMETGFKASEELDAEHEALLSKLNSNLREKTTAGYRIIKQDFGTETNESGSRNLHYHILLAR